MLNLILIILLQNAKPFYQIDNRAFIHSDEYMIISTYFHARTEGISLIVFTFSTRILRYFFKNNLLQIVSYASSRGGISVSTERGETSRSILLIQNAKPTDSGSYQCNPSNAKPANVTIHVLNGKF